MRSRHAVTPTVSSNVGALFRGWCNWQHDRFWSCKLGFESLPPSKVERMTHQTTAIVLAAGQGTRMRSTLPKVLHKIAGRAMLGHVVGALTAAGVGRLVVVVGHGADDVRSSLDADAASGAFGPVDVAYAVQSAQLGTGDAARVGLAAAPHLPVSPSPASSSGAVPADQVLILAGDTPLVTPELISRLLDAGTQKGVVGALVAARIDDPTGYGRVLRDSDGNADAIVEQADATADQLAIDEINAGMYLVDRAPLEAALERLAPQNAQGEFYLTDIVEILRQSGQRLAICTAEATEVAGVNNRAQLAEAAQVVRARINDRWMRSGVAIIDPAATYIDLDARLQPDCTIQPGTTLTGHTVVEAGATVGPHTTAHNAHIGANANVAHSWVVGARIGRGANVGPFAHLRDGTVLDEGSKVGSFAETKNAHLAVGAKVPHLSYVGDAEVGAKANVGAGTITANYDGVNKSKTVIGDGAFIGSNSVLVAPVNIGAGAKTGAGAVVTHDVAPGDTVVGVPARSLGRATPSEQPAETENNRASWQPVSKKPVPGPQAHE